MSKVSKNYHLMKRDGVYYYRRKVPTHLVSAIGKKVIQVSLHTKDWGEAAKLRTLKELETEAKFLKAAESQESGATIMTSLTYDEALQIVREDLEAADEKLQIMEAKPGPVTERKIRDSQIENEMFVQMLKDLNDPKPI